MQTIEVSVAELSTMGAPYNPRVIDKHDLQSLGRSMRFFGVVEPVVVNKRSGNIVGGHQRVKAAQAEGIETLPVVEVDLDDPAEKQLNLALNRISGTWDEDALAALLADLQGMGADLDLTGFEDEEIERLLTAITNPEGGQTDPDVIPEPLPDACTLPGDIIVLGRHRLFCGDAGDPEALAQLLQGDLVQLVNTDPPYNVNVEPRSVAAVQAGVPTKGQAAQQTLDRAAGPAVAMRARDRVLPHDKMDPEAFRQTLKQWFGAIAAALEPGRSFYIWGGYSNIAAFPEALSGAGLHFSQTLIWHKQWPVIGRHDFMGDHEWCFYGWKKGAPHYFTPGVNNATDHWTVRKVTPQNMIHLTEKPVELAELAIKFSTRHEETVLDLFAGSGSTLIAAERMNRAALLMELDPIYCDVIVRRWQEYTGKKAEGWRGNEDDGVPPVHDRGSESGGD